MKEEIKKISLFDKLKEIEDTWSDVEIISFIGDAISEHANPLDAIKMSMKWIKNMMNNKTKEYIKHMAELVEKVADVSETNRDLQKVVSEITAIGIEQILEVDEMPKIIDQVLLGYSQRSLEELRKVLENGQGVNISDTIVEPELLPDGTLGASSSYSGELIFGIIKDESEVAIKSLVPSTSSNITLVERHNFDMPIELLLLAFSSDDRNMRYSSSDKENIVRKESKLSTIKDIKNLKFNSKSNLKIQKIEEIIKQRESGGFEFLAMTIQERLEPFIHPKTKLRSSVYATNISVILLKKGTPIVIGSPSYDELKIEGWRFNEYNDIPELKGTLEKLSILYNDGWTMRRDMMENTITKLTKFADSNIESYIKKVTNKD